MLKINFAGSIRGGRADADLHKKIMERTLIIIKPCALQRAL